MTYDSARQRERWANDPEFVERSKARANRWHAAHREELATKERARRAADPEAARAYDKEVRERRKLSPEEVLKTRARAAKWKRDNPDRWRSNALKAAFGITLADYECMFSEQGGICAICREPESRVRGGQVLRLSVDHDHVTGQVRGLLCMACNAGIGYFRDNPDLLRQAAQYVQIYERVPA